MKRLHSMFVTGLVIFTSLSLLWYAQGCSKKQNEAQETKTGVAGPNAPRETKTVAPLKQNLAQETKIGVVGPFSSVSAPYGPAMKRGYELATENIVGVRLIYEDDKLRPEEGVSAISKLISADGVKVVLGSVSRVTLAMAPVAERNKVILFSSISSSDELRKSGEYIFRNVPRDEVQGTTAADFLYKRLHKTTVAILKKNSEYGTSLAGSFRRQFQQMGGKVVFDEGYQPNASDFRAVIANIRDVSPQAVYIVGNYLEIGPFLKQAVEEGLQVVIVGSDGAYSPELARIAGNAAEGTYYTIMGVQKNTDYYRDFEKKFTARYQRQPDVYDAYAYEAASIIMQAINEAGYDSTKIRDYLLSHTFASLTGPLTFDQDGEVNRPYGIVTVSGGKFVDVE